MNDTAAVQARIDSAAAAGGGVVVLEPGAYDVTGLTLAAHVTLRGEGAVLRQLAGSSGAVVTLPATAAAARLERIEIDGAASAQTGQNPGVVSLAPHAVVADCHVHDTAWDGIVVANASSRWVTVSGNRVRATGRYGITLNGSSTDYAEHVVVHGNHVEQSQNGALGIVGVAHHVVFSSNTTRDHGGDGIAAYNAANRDVTCTGNTFHRPGNHGIHLGGQRLAIVGNTAHDVGTGHGWFLRNHDGSTLHQGTVANNLLNGTSAGEGVRVEDAQSVSVTGNVCEAPYRDGVMIRNAADVTVTGNVVRNTQTGRGISLLSAQRLTVTGNEVRNAALEAIYGADPEPYVTFCQFVTVTGNTISNAGGTGVYSTGSSNRWLVANNVITGTVSAIGLVGANNVVGPNLTG